MKSKKSKVRSQKLKSKFKSYFTFNFLLVLLTFAFLLLTFTPRVSAQQVSLSFSPSLMEIFIQPGKSVMLAYRLENNGDPIVVRTKVLPFEPRGNDGRIEIKQEFSGPIRFNLTNANLGIEQPLFLKTKDSQQLLLDIRVPEGAPEGDYYYTFLAETQPAPGLEGATGSQAKAVIGSNLLITVTKTGFVEIKSKIAIFDVLPRIKFKILGRTVNIADSNDKIPIVLIVDNNGKNLIKPEGKILLRGNFGERADFDLVPQNILSQSQRLTVATPSAEGKTKKSNSLVLSGFFIGSYKLSTSINFGEGSPNLFASVSFIALPFRFIFGIIVAFIVIKFIVRRLSEKEGE